MAEIDPVVLRLIAETGQYRADIDKTTRRVNSQLDSQGKSVKRLESQFKSSSSQIAKSFGAVSASIGAGFSVSAVTGMADSYTRFTNSLKVAGLEGQALADVQERLFQVAQKNGVELESVGQLYSRAAQNQKELGASTDELINLTRAVSASLRISGTSTQEASGALLQLGQALGSPRIQAEEFNSLLDTMQPLLREVAKYVDGTSGSLAGLVRVIKDTKGEGVSNVQLFDAVQKAMAALEETASKSSLTISAAFTNLSNAMTKYIGEADKANGASAVVTQGLQALANNLDVVSEALAVIAAVMLGRFAASMTAGALGALRASAAANTTTASFNAMTLATTRASTSMSVMGGMATRAGSSLLAAFGGPIGAAVAALTVGLGLMAVKSAENAAASDALSSSIELQEAKLELLNAEKRKANAETDKLTAVERAALTATANLTGEANLLATAWGRVAAEAKRAAIEQAKAFLSEATTNKAKASARVERREFLDRGLEPTNIVAKGLKAVAPGLYGYDDKEKAKEKDELTVAIRNETKARENLSKVEREQLSEFKQDATPTTGKKDPKKKGEKKPKGPDLGAIQNRFIDELAAGEMAIKEAQAAALGTAEARRGLEADRIEYERQKNIRDIKNDKDLNEAQKNQLLLLNERIAKEKVQAVNADAMAEASERKKVAAQNQGRYEEDALRAEAEMAGTRKASLEANLRILELLEKREKAELEALIQAEQIADADKARADLAKTQTARRDEVNKNHESPLQQRKRELSDASKNMGDAVEQIGVDAMDRFGDSIANAATQYIKLGGIAGDVINGIIQDLIKLAAKQAIMGLFGGDGKAGALAGIGKSLGFRASGGSVVGGAGYIVGENGPEFFRPTGSGSIISNRALSQGISGRGNVPQPVVVKVEAGEYFDARVDNRASGVAAPIASRSASEYSGASYAMSQRSAPGTMQKYNQLKG